MTTASTPARVDGTLDPLLDELQRAMNAYLVYPDGLLRDRLFIRKRRALKRLRNAVESLTSNNRISATQGEDGKTERITEKGRAK